MNQLENTHLRGEVTYFLKIPPGNRSLSIGSIKLSAIQITRPSTIPILQTTIELSFLHISESHEAPSLLASSITNMYITNLPVELICDMCSYLDLSTWSALRLTCRALYTNTLDASADNFRVALSPQATAFVNWRYLRVIWYGIEFGNFG